MGPSLAVVYIGFGRVPNSPNSRAVLLERHEVLNATAVIRLLGRLLSCLGTWILSGCGESGVVVSSQGV